MISLSSLPVEVLKEVFHHLNQHYTLTLAPLHSRFYYIAKPKLYRNIYVYSPWPIYDELKKPKDWNETFHISKSLNNLKSKKYTIISSDTLERYLAKMDRAQEIYHFELYVYNVTMIDCILRHFTTIRYFETLLNYKPPEPGESADYKVYNSLIFTMMLLFLFPLIFDSTQILSSCFTFPTEIYLSFWKALIG